MCGLDHNFLVTVLAFSSLPLCTTLFLVRPFLHGPIRVEKPKHNFWPYIPVSVPEMGQNETRFFKRPDHDFWPFVPVQKPYHTRSSYFNVPRHNFWPFIPVVPPVHPNDTKPVTPPPPMPTSPEPENRYDYAEVLHKSLLFYEAQRSGLLPAKRKVRWRGHSALDDRGENGEDLSGGWYDAGDYVKFGLPMASATTMLLLGLTEFREAYVSLSLLHDMYDCVRWPLDYFMKAHPSRYEFYAQDGVSADWQAIIMRYTTSVGLFTGGGIPVDVSKLTHNPTCWRGPEVCAIVGDPYVDHTYWGRPEDMNMYRPAYKLSPDSPGSDVIGETAAALAAGAIVFRDVDSGYSTLLLRHAMELFEFAARYQGLYSDSLPIVQEFYSSSGFHDELAWAATWLYRATGDIRYLQVAEDYYVSTECWAVSWDSKDCLAALLLYKLTHKDIYRSDIVRTLRAWMPGGSVDYTPAGLAFRSSWGPLRYTANMATLALIAAQAGIEPLTYRRWARSQIHYMLGDSGRSFVIGFGHNPPLRPHHASSSCPPRPRECSWSQYYTSAPNPITLYGALVGGPDLDDSFDDDRDDYYQSEVTCDYNAGFQSAIAGLLQLELLHKRQGPLSTQERTKTTENNRSTPTRNRPEFSHSHWHTILRKSADLTIRNNQNYYFQNGSKKVIGRTEKKVPKHGINKTNARSSRTRKSVYQAKKYQTTLSISWLTRFLFRTHNDYERQTKQIMEG